MQRRSIHVLALGLAAALASCTSPSESIEMGGGTLAPSDGGAAPGDRVEVPAHAAAAPALESLDMLVGRWVAVNPNGTVNEEVWLPVRGNVALGAFRQVRLDGDCSFAEMSQIAIDGEGRVVLRLRHLHGELQVPESRKDVSLFELVSIDPRRVVFRGVGDSAQVVAMTYERVDAVTLVQSLEFDPESGQPAFVTTYRRDG